MSILTPSFEGRTIYRVTEFDLLSIPKSPGKIYACTDSRRLYEDISNIERKVLAVGQIASEIDRIYNFKPNNGVYYYVWETNTLWLYNYGWELVIGDKSQLNQDTVVYPSGVEYIDKNGCCDNNNNGILGDGSVVIRDFNRLIKSKIFIDETDNDLVISSFLGGGLKLLPSGSMDEKGSLLIKNGKLHYYGNSEFEGKILTTEDIHVIKESGNYKVYTEEDFIVGEWEFDGNDVIDKLNKLPQPINLDVIKFDGHTSDYYARAEHTHTTDDISNLEEFIRDNRKRALTSGLQNKGVVVEYNKNNDTYTFVPDSFIISIEGGAKGSGSVRNLQDVSINIKVDPLKHKHHYNELTGIDDILNKFNDYVPKTDTVTDPVPNKLLYLDGSGNLPTDITGNSNTSDKWKTGRLIRLINGASGQVIIDGSTDIDIDVTIDPLKHEHEQYVLNSDIGTKIPSLNETTKKIPKIYLDDQSAYPISFMGNFNPVNGFPSITNVLKGYAYISTSNGIISGEPYFTGDIVIYDGNNWKPIHSKGLVHSVNGQTGEVNIDLETAIGEYLFNPDSPEENKIPVTILDKESNKYFLNADAIKYAKYLINPIKIQFEGDISSSITDIYMDDSEKINKIRVQASIDDGVIEVLP